MPCCIDRMRFSPRFTIRKEKLSLAFSFLFFFLFSLRTVRATSAAAYGIVNPTSGFFSNLFKLFCNCSDLNENNWNDPWAALRARRFEVRRFQHRKAIKIFESNLGDHHLSGYLNERCAWLRKIKAEQCPRPLCIHKKKKSVGKTNCHDTITYYSVVTCPDLSPGQLAIRG